MSYEFLDKYDLSPQQFQALDLLLSGKTITDVATEIGVARETVSRWRNHDPGFKAAFYSEMRSVENASQTKRHEAQSKAIDKLLELLESDNEATVLKACAALMKMNVELPSGGTDPVVIENGDNYARSHWLTGF